VLGGKCHHPCAVSPEHRVSRHQEGLGSLPGHGCEDVAQLVGMPDGEELQLETQDARRGLDLSQRHWVGGIGRILEDSDAGDMGQGLFEELEPFAT
jgi:hypothetical protein